jgi:hypothetical protein
MQMPLHAIIEIQMGVTGVQEKRYKLMETQKNKKTDISMKYPGLQIQQWASSSYTQKSLVEISANIEQGMMR